jgi:cytochrome c peroxidase
LINTGTVTHLSSQAATFQCADEFAPDMKIRVQGSSLRSIAGRVAVCLWFSITVAAPPEAAKTASQAQWEVNDNGPPTPAAVLPDLHPTAAELDALGRHLFFDRSVSASGQVACATCHDPKFAYGPPNARAVQLGGAALTGEGTRAAPSLRYIERVPVFTDHYFDEDVDESIDNGPTGGLTWDGRAPSAHDQALIPLLSPLEMANGSGDAVVQKVAQSAYKTQFQAAFGADIFAHPQEALAAITRSLEVFLDNPQEFFPYSSKYDAVLRHQASLTPSERRGLELFNDPAKGNCAHCHPSTIGQSGAFPAFTDYGYAALAVPRNRTLRVNRDREYFDLGLCGPFRTDLRDRTELCGMFRTPSLRNVTLRHTFFHNGRFHDLKDVLHFYVQRDILPERWYSRSKADGVRKYDDLPGAYQRNVNREPPFDRDVGSQPALSEAEIRDIIAFLDTLRDGWVPR